MVFKSIISKAKYWRPPSSEILQIVEISSQIYPFFKIRFSVIFDWLNSIVFVQKILSKSSELIFKKRIFQKYFPIILSNNQREKFALPNSENLIIGILSQITPIFNIQFSLIFVIFWWKIVLIKTMNFILNPIVFVRKIIY